MSFLRVTQLKRTLSLCNNIIRITATQPQVNHRLLCLNRHFECRYFSRPPLSQLLSSYNEDTITPKIENYTSQSADLRLFDSLLNTISQYSETRQRVDSRDIKEVLQILRSNENISLSHVDAVLLLRCCGKYMPKESPKKRTELVNLLWEEIKKSGFRLAVSHFNARLLAFLENDEPFLVHEELAAIDQEGLRANRTTYQLMIDKLCRDGDLFVANEIKKHMEELGIPVTNIVYFNFIKANVRQGNMEEVENIKDIMVKAGYQIGPKAYSAMMEGYAEIGDLESIRKLMDEADKRGVDLDTNQFREVLLSFCKRGEEDKAQELIELLPVGVQNQTMINIMLEMITLGCNESAVAIYRRVDPSFPIQTSHAVLVHQISSGVPASVIAKTWAELREMNRLTHSFDQIVLLAMHIGTPEQILDFIDIMHEQGEPIWNHFFTPAIKKYARQQNCEGMEKAFKMLMKLSGDKSKSHIFGFLSFEILSDLECLPQDERNAMLKRAGVPEDEVNIFTVHNLLLKGNIKEALDFYETNNRPLVPTVMLRHWLKVRINFCDDYISAINFLASTKERDDLNTMLLAAMARNPDLQNSVLEKGIQQFIENKMFISRNENELTPIRNDLMKKGISLKLFKMLAYPTEFKTEATQRRLFSAQFSGVDQSDNYQVSKQNENNLKMASIRKLCTELRKEEAYKAKSLCESEGLNVTSLLPAFANMEAKLGNIDEAVKITNYLDTKDVPNLSYGPVCLVLTSKLVLLKRTDEAILILERYADTHADKIRNAYAEFATRVVSDVSKIHGFDTTRRFYDAVQRHFTDKLNVQPIFIDMVHRLVTSVECSEEPIEKIVDLMEYCRNEFGVAVFSSIMMCLVENEDAKNLQRVVDLMAERQGENTTVLHLLVSLVKKGRIEEAKRLAQSPGIQSDSNLFNEAFKGMEDKVDVENLMEVIKHMPGIRKDFILFHQIRSFCLAKDYDKAVEILMQYRKENGKPSGYILRYLGKSLKNEGLPIPFRVPWIDVTQWIKSIDEIIFLRDSEPDQLAEFEEKQRRLIGKDSAKQNLLNILLMRGHFGEAVTFLEQNFRALESLDFEPVVEKLYAQGSVETLDNVLQMLLYLKATVHKKLLRPHIETCYSYMLQLAADNKDINKCTEIMQSVNKYQGEIKVSEDVKAFLRENNIKTKWGKIVSEDADDDKTEMSNNQQMAA